MRVAEFVKKNNEVLPKELAELLNQEQSIWTNEACRGYMITALENAGMNREGIMDMLRYLSRAFDELSVEEAEQKWRSF